MSDLRIERWEDDEFVITIDGKPCGHTYSKHDAAVIVNFLQEMQLKEMISFDMWK